MNKIVTYTVNPALDVNTATEKVRTGEKLRCEEPSREVGGGGINVSRALKRLGLNSSAIFTKGGPIGDLYQQILEKEGFEKVPVEINTHTRESITVQDKESGELYRFVLPGAELKEEIWKDLLDRVSEFDDVEYLVASGSLPPGVPDDFYARLSKKARENDIKFVLDTSKEPLKKILDPGAYLVKPNKKELNQLAGKELKDHNERAEAAEKLVKEHDIEILVVSLGADGAILATKDGVKRLESPSIEKKKSAVGAGDSMVAGMVYSLSNGKDISEAVSYGLSCGTAALLTPGTELLHKEDADKLMDSLESLP
ncbi:MAG: 1-phosphofructokinase family hexose kinase [Candidatus Cyclobacteriaceae bacterium M2_1C_046]